MTEFKLNISDPKTGRTTQKDVKDDATLPFMQKKLGDKVEGSAIAPGYVFEITGGSDYCGFPLRKGIQGLRRKAIVCNKGVGFRQIEKSKTIRKNVCPEVVTETTKQINVKIVTAGSESLFPEKAA
ncbi:30S ribosomal protein S6e [Candidatus Woesearchaeota archaeon]|nr:30S ribosomal protein S6e [Candidatus Woesearchaeota archaeon]